MYRIKCMENNPFFWFTNQPCSCLVCHDSSSHVLWEGAWDVLQGTLWTSQCNGTSCQDFVVVAYMSLHWYPTWSLLFFFNNFRSLSQWLTFKLEGIQYLLWKSNSFFKFRVLWLSELHRYLSLYPGKFHDGYPLDLPPPGLLHVFSQESLHFFVTNPRVGDGWKISKMGRFFPKVFQVHLTFPQKVQDCKK